MPSLIDYKGLQVVDPQPTGDGGLAIQNDFKSLVDWNPKSVWNESADPSTSDDETADFYPGSLWLRTNTTPPKLFVCESADTGAAVWRSVLMSISQDAAPSLGGDLEVNGHQITSAAAADIIINPGTEGKIGLLTDSPITACHIKGNGQTLTLEGSDHTYVGWYPDGIAAGRKAWTGFSNGTDNNFTIQNLISGAHIRLQTTNGFVGAGQFPTSPLTVNGALSTPVTTQTAAYTLTAYDSVILCNASSAAFTITLPTAVGISGRQYTIKRLNSGSNDVTIDGNGSQTIDGSTTLVLTTQYETARIVSDGANWWRV